MVLPLSVPLGRVASEIHSAAHLGARVEIQYQLTKIVMGYVSSSYLLNLATLLVCVTPTLTQIYQAFLLYDVAILLLSSLVLNLDLLSSDGV